MKFGLWAALVALMTDQLSKYYIGELFAQDPTVRVKTAFFNLVDAWNTGVSFSMFAQGGIVGTVCLTVFALAVIGFLCVWLYREQNRLTAVSLGLIIGGALGNVIDRIRFGAVYDFLDFHYGAAHWPAFNAADTFICMGAGMIILNELFLSKHNTVKGENQ